MSGDTPLAGNDTFTQNDIDSNQLTYEHDGSASSSDSFVFSVIDGNGGEIQSTTFNITVTALNNAIRPAESATGNTESEGD